MDRVAYSFRGGCGRERGGLGGRGGMFMHPFFGHDHRHEHRGGHRHGHGHGHGHRHGFEASDMFGSRGVPNGFGGFGSSPLDSGLSGFGPEVVAAALRELFNTATPFLQEVVSHLDEATVEQAFQLLLNDTERNETGPSSSGSSQQFSERVTVDKSGDQERHRVDINLGVDAKADSLKISRKDHVMTINIKTEKSAEDGSSRLYQEYTKKITLPENVELRQLESTLSPEGVLTIQAPLISKPEEARAASQQSSQIPVILIDDDDMTD